MQAAQGGTSLIHSIPEDLLERFSQASTSQGGKNKTDQRHSDVCFLYPCVHETERTSPGLQEMGTAQKAATTKKTMGGGKETPTHNLTSNMVELPLRRVSQALPPPPVFFPPSGFPVFVSILGRKDVCSPSFLLSPSTTPPVRTRHT